MTPDQIVAQAQERGLQLVRFLYCDNGGVIRGKSTYVGSLGRRIGRASCRERVLPTV